MGRLTRDQFRELCIYRPLTYEVTRNNTAVDLSSLDASAVKLTVFSAADPTDVLIDHAAMSFVTDGSDGQVEYQASAAQLAAGSAGEYGVQIEIFWEATKAEAVLVTDTVEIAAHVGTHP